MYQVNTRKLMLILCTLYACCNVSFAASTSKENSKLETQANRFSVSDNIVKLVALSKRDLNAASDMLVNVERSMLGNGESNLTQFNHVEQFLILLVKAKIKQHENHHKETIALIEAAKLLVKELDKEQLNKLIFSEAYFVLANSYVAIKDFENAYLNNKKFIDDYNTFMDDKRENSVDILTKKYEVSHKIEENKLLENKNKLEALRLNAVYVQQQEQQTRLVLISCTLILLFLLFLRQLSIRKKLLLLLKTDSLTGLVNRTALFKKGHDLVYTASQRKEKFSVLLFELENFKAINEQFGHSVGDVVLSKIAQLVNETMRARDILSCLGEEEFVALLPNTTNDKAKAIAVRVMEKIVQHNFSDCGIEPKLTLSMGIANLSQSKQTFDDIIQAANIAKSQAKANGCNQMVSNTN